MDFLKSAVASAIAKGSSFPYIFGDRLDSGESIWTLHNATKRDDGSSCSIFIFDLQKNRSLLPLARNALRKLRTLRHPGIIKVLDTVETEGNIYIVVEKITPLTWHVKRKSISEETGKWGLYMVASTIKFINDDATSVHGNVRSSSIYTSESGEWKVGGFEVLSSMKEDDAIIYNYGSLMPDSGRFAPPEVSNGGWTAIKRSPLTATDSFGLGILTFEVFGGSFHGADQLAQTKSLPPSMVQSYRRLVNSNPKLRSSAGLFVEHGQRAGGFFETPLIRLTTDIDNLGLKSESERDQFLSELDALSDDFPEDYFKMKVLPELLKSVEFGGGGAKVFVAVLKIGSKLPDDEYEAKLVPVIVRLFCSADRAMRVCLLDNLPLMIHRLSQKDVTNKIFPSMVTGFIDAAPVVREQTVKAVLTIIGKLTDRAINGELLRYLAKTANDEQPGIRTNTTICLGKIAKNLGMSSRSKVLIAAFTRSLRDPFVHARNAALMALSATIDIFSEEDSANKILPSLCPSLLDKEKIIRDQANKTLDLYLLRVRKRAAGMSDTVLPAADAASTANPESTRMGNASDTSWAGWAISSFTNKIAAARGEIQPSVNGSASLIQADVPVTALPEAGRTTPAALPSSDSHSTVRIRHEPATTDISTSVDEESSQDFEAWGPMGDEEDSFFDAPSTKKQSPSPQAAMEHDDSGEPDFASWLAAHSQAKSKKPLPKGLTKTSNLKPSVIDRSMSTGRIGSGMGAQKPISATSMQKVTMPVKKIDTQPKQTDLTEDGWGDDWD